MGTVVARRAWASACRSCKSISSQVRPQDCSARGLDEALGLHADVEIEHQAAVGPNAIAPRGIWSAMARRHRIAVGNRVSLLAQQPTPSRQRASDASGSGARCAEFRKGQARILKAAWPSTVTAARIPREGRRARCLPLSSTILSTFMLTLISTRPKFRSTASEEHWPGPAQPATAKFASVPGHFPAGWHPCHCKETNRCKTP